MKTKYAVLNNKLFPVNVAELLLNEGVGSVHKSVQITYNPLTDPDFIQMDNLFIKALEADLVHSFTTSFVSDMLSKLIKNNNYITGKIIIKIVQGEKTFLHIYFI